VGRRDECYSWVGRQREVQLSGCKTSRASSAVLTTYYDTSGSLFGVAVDARSGPQVTLEEMRLVGRVPSELEEQFVQVLEASGWMVTYNQFWNFSCNVLGIVVRAQRVDDVVLRRQQRSRRGANTGLQS
jgi:hypothetical protein